MSREMRPGAFVYRMLTFYQVAYAGIKSKSSRTNRCGTHVAAFAFSWTDDITKGLDDTLSQSRVPLALHVEYMDTKRVVSHNYDEELAAFYQKKFQGISFAVIVCSDISQPHLRIVEGLWPPSVTNRKHLTSPSWTWPCRDFPGWNLRRQCERFARQCRSFYVRATKTSRLPILICQTSLIVF